MSHYEHNKMKTTELQIKENSEGDLYFNIPDNLLERLGWEEGDEIKFIEKDGGFLLTKVKYETIELDFDDDELFKYMKIAHEKGMSFNEWVEDSLKQIIKELE
jgi:bifunctional DNA-binding transcriptional regulator/antitoxin component of YhaV-PrlF toxin-antitoxin module